MTPAAINQALLMRNNYSDPLIGNVKLLTHFDGGYADSGPYNKTPGPTAGTVITASSLYGSGAVDCTANSDCGVAYSGLELALSTSNFCAECWIKDPDGTANRFWWHIVGSTGQAVRLFIPVSSGLRCDSTSAATTHNIAYSLNTWHHTAVTRNGSNWTLWLNGSSVAIWTDNTFDGGAGSCSVWLGRGSSATTSKQSYMDEFRLTVGNARYTASFSPVGPFPNP